MTVSEFDLACSCKISGNRINPANVKYRRFGNSYKAPRKLLFEFVQFKLHIKFIVGGMGPYNAAVRFKEQYVIQREEKFRIVLIEAYLSSVVRCGRDKLLKLDNGFVRLSASDDDFTIIQLFIDFDFNFKVVHGCIIHDKRLI